MQNRLLALVRLRWLFVALGLALLGGGVAGQVYEASRSAGDAPLLRQPNAIAVSDAGEIFVFSEWGRVRVFSPQGRELRSWRVDTRSGMAVLAFEAPQVLLVATARNDRLYRFSPVGELLDSVRDPAALDRIGTRRRKWAKGPSGGTYQVSDMSVLRRDPGGEVRVVVPGVPAVLRPFFFGTLPPILFAVQGAVVLALGAALVAQKHRFDLVESPS